MASRLFVLALVALGATGSVAACGGGAGSANESGADGGASSGNGGNNGGGGEGGGEGVLSTPVPPPAGAGAELCQKTLGLVLSEMETCCTEQDKTTTPYELTVALGGLMLQSCSERLEAAIAKGRVMYRPDKVQHCLAAYRQAIPAGVCDAITEPRTPLDDDDVEACRGAFVGLGGEGAPCLGNAECVDGLTCVGATKDTDGSCKAPPAVGEPCGRVREVDGGVSFDVVFDFPFERHPACAGDARCRRASSNAQNECVAGRAAGEACGSNDDCATGLGCYLEKCAAEPSDVAGACRTNQDCKRGLYCEGATGVDDGTCQPKKIAGGTCHQTVANTNSECIGRCDAPEQVGSEGTCVSYCGSR